MTATNDAPVLDQDAIAKAVLDYIDKHQPEIATLVRKDATAGDVHSPTALGNEEDERRRRKPISTVADVARKRGIDVRNDDDAAGDADWKLPLDIVKAAPDQRLIFGWASISEKGGELVVDKQGDVILPEDLEKAAYDFVLYAREHGDMHVKKGTGRLVESMIFTTEKQKVLGVDLGHVGWWVGFRVDDDALWAAHKRGERPEFSIGGKGRRVPI